MDERGKQVYWHQHSVSVDERRKQSGCESCVIWFTGLPSAGKSTLANVLCRRLFSIGVQGYVLDGDNIRHGLNSDLGFSPEDRMENIRRIAEVAKLFVDAGMIAMTAFISPYRGDRLTARKLMRKREFIEVYAKCSIDECESRDPKGLYKQARSGALKSFTGVSAPYEEPENPEIVLETDKLSIDECSRLLLDYLVQHDYLERFRVNRVEFFARNRGAPIDGLSNRFRHKDDDSLYRGPTSRSVPLHSE
jgi:adenylylsulfate kinase